MAGKGRKEGCVRRGGGGGGNFRTPVFPHKVCTPDKQENSYRLTMSVEMC